MTNIKMRIFYDVYDVEEQKYLNQDQVRVLFEN